MRIEELNVAGKERVNQVTLEFANGELPFELVVELPLEFEAQAVASYLRAG